MESLRVIVADDEYPIRKWFSRTLKNLPDIRVEMAGTASNGEEALALIREKHPDVVFTDIKMPVMDGLKLLRVINRDYPRIKVVIITSYDEFAYAKEAIALNAYDYVLKTEANSRMLSDLLRKIQQEQQESYLQKDELVRRFEQTFFLTSLLAQKGGQIDRETLRNHGINWEERGLFAIAFYTNQIVSDRMPEIFMNAGVENVLYYAWQQNIVIAVGNTNCIEQLAYQHQVIFQFAEKISRCFATEVGICGPYFQYGQLVEMMMKSVEALNLSFYQKRAGRIFYARDVVDFAQIAPELEELGQTVMELARTGEREKLIGQMGRLMDFLENRSPGDVIAVKQFLFRLTANACQMLCRDLPGLPDVIAQLYRSIEHGENFPAIRRSITEQLEQQGRAACKVQYSPYVMHAMEYIEKNYARITYISDVAKDVGLNEDYLGHLFKSETGITVNQFLNNTRMNQAVWLLNNTQLKAYEIAYKVGYANPGYFSRLFKQRFLISPYEFRTAHEKK